MSKKKDPEQPKRPSYDELLAQVAKLTTERDDAVKQRDQWQQAVIKLANKIGADTQQQLLQAEVLANTSKVMERLTAPAPVAKEKIPG